RANMLDLNRSLANSPIDLLLVISVVRQGRIYLASSEREFFREVFDRPPKLVQLCNVLYGYPRSGNIGLPTVFAWIAHNMLNGQRNHGTLLSIRIPRLYTSVARSAAPAATASCKNTRCDTIVPMASFRSCAVITPYLWDTKTGKDWKAIERRTTNVNFDQ